MRESLSKSNSLRSRDRLSFQGKWEWPSAFQVSQRITRRGIPWKAPAKTHAPMADMDESHASRTHPRWGTGEAVWASETPRVISVYISYQKSFIGMKWTCNRKSNTSVLTKWNVLEDQYYCEKQGEAFARLLLYAVISNNTWLELKSCKWHIFSLLFYDIM